MKLVKPPVKESDGPSASAKPEWMRAGRSTCSAVSEHRPGPRSAMPKRGLKTWRRLERRSPPMSSGPTSNSGAPNVVARSSSMKLKRGGNSRNWWSQQAAGLAGEFDVQRAAATFEAARARLPLVEAEVALATQRLATLTGQPAATAALRRSMGGIPMTATPGPTLPADLLRMRPDIRRSELTVLQRAALAEVAYAELFPRLTLGGSIEVRANVLATPIAGTPVTVAGGPGISIPLFDWGQRRALLNAREAELKEGIASYRRVVLEAVGEVEIALSQVRQQALRVDRLRTAVDAARRAFVTAQRLYQAGEINLTERLQAEADLRQAELDFAAASETRAVALVTLYRALGAGPGRLPALPAPTAAPPRSLASSPASRNEAQAASDI